MNRFRYVKVTQGHSETGTTFNGKSAERLVTPGYSRWYQLQFL